MHSGCCPTFASAEAVATDAKGKGEKVEEQGGSDQHVGEAGREERTLNLVRPWQMRSGIAGPVFRPAGRFFGFLHVAEYPMHSQPSTCVSKRREGKKPRKKRCKGATKGAFHFPYCFLFLLFLFTLPEASLKGHARPNFGVQTCASGLAKLMGERRKKNSRRGKNEWVVVWNTLFHKQTRWTRHGEATARRGVLPTPTAAAPFATATEEKCRRRHFFHLWRPQPSLCRQNAETKGRGAQAARACG